MSIAFQPRRFGAINWIGLKTLYLKEVRRFLKVYLQTVIAPAVTALLFFAIFALALEGAVRELGGVPFLEFLAPGLIMMALAQNAFANTSTTLIVAKMQGTVVDLMLPPLSPAETLVAVIAGGVSRALLIGALLSLALLAFVPIGVEHWGFVLFHAVAASIVLSLLGLIAAIWAEKFDHVAAVNNFIVTPLAFLSGTFYSVEQLPEPLVALTHANPFFYMIDGFRYGFIGYADGSLDAGLAVMAGSALALCILAHRMLASGYKLKA